MSCGTGGGFGASSGINPVNGFGNIPTSQVTVYDGATLPVSGGSGSLNSVLLALDSKLSGKNGIFSPANTGLQVADGFIVNQIGNLTFNVPAGFEFTIDGKLNVTGLIDPTGLELTPQSSNPSNAYTLWVNTSDSHIYRGSVDLEKPFTSQSIYDGAAVLNTFPVTVGGDLNLVLSEITSELLTVKNSITTVSNGVPTGTTNKRTFRVAPDNSTIIEDDFFTNTGSQIGIGIGAAGTHFAGLSFGVGQLAQYDTGRNLTTAHINTLVDKKYVSDYFSAIAATIPVSLWEEGITNPTTTFLSNPTNNVVIGDSDISTTDKLLISKNDNSITSLKVSNTTDGSSSGAYLIANGGSNLTANLSYIHTNNSITEWKNKAVLYSGTSTSGLILNSGSNITLQTGGNGITNNIVNVSSTGVSIGLQGAASTAILDVSGIIKLSDLGGGTTNAGDVLTLQADGTAVFSAGVGLKNIYDTDGNSVSHRTYTSNDGVDDFDLNFVSGRRFLVNLFDSIELNSSNSTTLTSNVSIEYNAPDVRFEANQVIVGFNSDTGYLRFEDDSQNNTGKIMKIIDGLGTVAFVDKTPLTTKGDIFTTNGTTDNRLPVGTNGQILSSDNATATGLKWIAAPIVGSTTYTGLIDTPNTFTGDSLKLVRVNAGETALEHVATSSINLSSFNNDLAAVNNLGAGNQLVPAATNREVQGGNILNTNLEIFDFNSIILNSGNDIDLQSSIVTLRSLNNLNSVKVDQNTGFGVELKWEATNYLTLLGTLATESLTKVLGRNASNQVVEVTFPSGASNLSLVTNGTTNTITNSNGTGVQLGVFNSSNAGLVPTGSGASAKFLRGDSTWQTLLFYFNRTGSHLSPVTPTDSISIGTATQSGTNKLTVVGDSIFTGDIEHSGYFNFLDTVGTNPALRLHQDIVSDIGRVTYEGINGALLTIVDDKDNELWTASDVSGNPIGYIDADWNVRFGNPFNRPLSIRYNSSVGVSYTKLVLPNYANDAAADADGNLLAGESYTTSALNRQIHIKP